MPDWELPGFAFFYPILVKLLRSIVILLVAVVGTKLMHRFVRGLRERIVAAMVKRTPAGASELEKRAATIGGILRNTAGVIIWAVAVIMVLQEGGFDIRPILAGAGVLGLAVGFGAQNLVRDVISGLFLLLENQIRVGDVAQINGTGGVVEEINLRTTVLRGLDGAVHVFPNGIISQLSNLTREFSYYVFSIGVAYKQDTDHVTSVIQEVASGLEQDPAFKDFILAPIDVLGVDEFGDSAVVIKARFKTQPVKQWAVGREMNRRLKKRFDEVGIEIPFPHQSLYWGEASKPIQLQMSGLDRGEIRSVVREVLAETNGAPAS